MEISKEMPLILGRPFLSTTGAHIDVGPKKSALTSMERKRSSHSGPRRNNVWWSRQCLGRTHKALKESKQLLPIKNLQPHNPKRRQKGCNERLKVCPRPLFQGETTNGKSCRRKVPLVRLKRWALAEGKSVLISYLIFHHFAFLNFWIFPTTCLKFFKLPCMLDFF